MPRSCKWHCCSGSSFSWLYRARNGGKADDEVIVTPRTFVASVSSIVNAGAIPKFADVDKNSGNINQHTIKAVLTKKTKGIVAVHLAGWPCDMQPIMELAREKNIRVIEDCAQAHGARYQGRSVGSLGDVAAWSFCQDKINHWWRRRHGHNK